MNSAFNFPKSKIPVPESPFLSSSRASLKILSELSDQVFFGEEDICPAPTYLLPAQVPSEEEDLQIPAPRVPVPSLTELDSDLSHLATPGPSSRRKMSKRKKPPDLKLRASSDLIVTKLEELLGGKNGGDRNLVPPPLPVSRSMDNLAGEADVPGEELPGPIPFQRISDRMDKRKSQSTSKLQNLGSPNQERRVAKSPEGFLSLKKNGESSAKKVDAKSEKGAEEGKENGKKSMRKPYSKSNEKFATASEAGTAVDPHTPVSPAVIISPIESVSSPTVPMPKSPIPKLPADTSVEDRKRVEETPGPKRQLHSELGKRVKVSSVHVKSGTPPDLLSVAGAVKRGATKSSDGKLSPTPSKSGESAGGDKKKGGEGTEKKGAHHVSDKSKGTGSSHAKELPLMEGKKEPNLGDSGPGGGLSEKEHELEKEKIRELALRVLVLSQKSDWHAVEQSLRYLEKCYVIGPHEEYKPLAGIADEVRRSTFSNLKKRWPL